MWNFNLNISFLYFSIWNFYIFHHVMIINKNKNTIHDNELSWNFSISYFQEINDDIRWLICMTLQVRVKYSWYHKKISRAHSPYMHQHVYLFCKRIPRISLNLSILILTFKKKLSVIIFKLFLFLSKKIL